MHSNRYLDLMAYQKTRHCSEKKWKSSGMLFHKNLSELLAILLREHPIAIWIVLWSRLASICSPKWRVSISVRHSPAHIAIELTLSVTFYSNEIFQQILGYNGTTSRVISGCLQIWQFCMATLAVFLVDRLGRRKLLMIGAAGMTIAQAGQAALIKYSHVSKSVAGATLLFDFLALAFFPIGLFLIPLMYSYATHLLRSLVLRTQSIILIETLSIK